MSIMLLDSHSLDPLNFQTRSISFDQLVQFHCSIAALFGQALDFELPHLSLQRSFFFGCVFGHPFDNQHDSVQSSVLLAQRLRVVVTSLEFEENFLIGEIQRIPVLGQESLANEVAVGRTHCETSMIPVSPRTKKEFGTILYRRKQRGFEQKVAKETKTDQELGFQRDVSVGPSVSVTSRSCGVNSGATEGTEEDLNRR
jgi:hypothetical protein